MDDARDQVEELTLEPVTVVRRPRPRALWGVLAALGLATGALVVTSGGGDGTTRPGLPVAFGSSARSAGAMAADAMLAPVTYVPGDGLPTLGGEAPAYRLRGSVDEARVRSLANALGLTGEITHDGPGWSLAGEGGTLGVYDGGGAQWWFSSMAYDKTMGGSASSSGSTGAGVACPEPITEPDGSIKVGDPSEAVLCGPNTPTTTSLTCDPVAGVACPDDTIIEPPVPTTIPPPADLPSKDEARGKALDVLAATGLDVDGADVTVDGPYDAWFVTVELRLDGLPSGLVASATIGSKGAVTSAAGFLVAPERLGDYPVLDTRATIDRANAQPGIGYPYRGGVGVETQMGVADSSGGAAAVEDPGIAVPGEAPVTTVVSCTDGTETCLPPELTCEEAMATSDVPLGAPETSVCTVPTPMPEPDVQPREVVLVDAVPSLVMLGAVDGSTDLYLVPGYRFTAVDAGQVDLPAVADEALTAPPTTNSSAITPIEPPVTDTVAPPCQVLVEGDASGTTLTVQPNPDCLEPVRLPVGEQPLVGVGYYVDVDTACGAFELGGEVWMLERGDLSTWSTPHEGGTFTLDAADHGTFVGDAAQEKSATFATGIAGNGCAPAPRP